MATADTGVSDPNLMTMTALLGPSMRATTRNALFNQSEKLASQIEAAKNMLIHRGYLGLEDAVTPASLATILNQMATSSNCNVPKALTDGLKVVATLLMNSQMEVLVQKMTERGVTMNEKILVELQQKATVANDTLDELVRKIGQANA